MTLTHTHAHAHDGVEHEHEHTHPPGLPHDHPHAHDHDHLGEHEHHGHHHHDHHHGHSHGLVDPSIVRSREGVKAVSASLAVLLVAALAQTAIYVLSGSVALLADLIHNFGDASTAIPLGAAFLFHSARGERWAGVFVVATIFASACVALWQSVERLIHPEHLSHLWVLAGAGAVGFAGNELAAQVRMRAGRRLESPALIADGNHARVDGFVSLGVIVSAAAVGLGVERADPIIGFVIALVILRVSRDSWRTVRSHASDAPAS